MSWHQREWTENKSYQKGVSGKVWEYVCKGLLTWRVQIVEELSQWGQSESKINCQSLVKANQDSDWPKRGQVFWWLHMRDHQSVRSVVNHWTPQEDSRNGGKTLTVFLLLIIAHVHRIICQENKKTSTSHVTDLLLLNLEWLNTIYSNINHKGLSFYHVFIVVKCK